MRCYVTHIRLLLCILVLSVSLICSDFCLTETDFNTRRIRRSEQDIAHRIAALSIVSAKGYGAGNGEIWNLIDKYAEKHYFTKDEYLFILEERYDHKNPYEHRFYEYKWRTLKEICSVANIR